MTIERRHFDPIRDREMWLGWRAHDVTASDIASVMGLNPNRTCAKVWAEKTGLIQPEPMSEFLKYRLCQEGAVFDWLTMFERPTWQCVRAGVYVRDSDIRLGCTPDVMAVDPKREGVGVVQIKTVAENVFEANWLKPDGKIIVPLDYQVQTQCEAMLTGATWATLAVEVMGYGGTGFFFLDEVDLNVEVGDRIKDVVVRFWADTTAGKVPKFDFALDADVIEALHPQPLVKEPAVDLSIDNRLPALLSKRRRRKDYIKSAEKWVDGADAEIKDKLGSHEAAWLPGWKITWKLQKREERIMPATQFRTLRITEQKGKTDGK
jgi:predicted phage-related endonuclease